MNTKTNQYQPKKHLNSQKRQQSKETKQSPVTPGWEADEEAFYELVLGDQELREAHVQKLLASPGRQALSREKAQEQVDAMLRLCVLAYELALQESRQQTRN